MRGTFLLHRRLDPAFGIRFSYPKTVDSLSRNKKINLKSNNLQWKRTRTWNVIRNNLLTIAQIFRTVRYIISELFVKVYGDVMWSTSNQRKHLHESAYFARVR